MDNQNPRHWLMLGLVGMLLLCAVAGVTAFTLAHHPEEVMIGHLSEFPVSANPYVRQVGDRMAFVVNTGDKFLVIARRYVPNPNIGTDDVLWVPTNQRYEAPLSGAKFTLTGEWIDVNYLRNVIEHRGLETYAVGLRGDEVWVTLAPLRPGVLEVAGTPTP